MAENEGGPQPPEAIDPPDTAEDNEAPEEISPEEQERLDQETRERRVESDREAVERAVHLEEAVNARLYGKENEEGEREGGTAIGRELMAKWDAAQAKRDENAPVGKWETVKFFLGGGSDRGELYREGKTEVKTTESSKTIMERAEHKYLVLGDRAKEMLGRVESDESLTDIQRKSLKKKALSALIKASNERSFMENTVLPDVKEKNGINASIQIEKGMNPRDLTFSKLMEDYPKKIKILSEIAAQAEDPEKVIQDILALASLGFVGNLSEENSAIFIKEQAGKIGRDLAENIVKSGLLEVLFSSKMEADISEFNSRELFGIYTSKERTKVEEKALKLGLRRQQRVATMKQGWENTGKHIAKFAKGVGAITVGMERPGSADAIGVAGEGGPEDGGTGVEPDTGILGRAIAGARGAATNARGFASDAMNMEGIDYDTPIREIIESGSNEYALVLQFARVAHNFVVPDSPSALTGPLFWIEDKIQWPARAIPILDRTRAVRNWTTNLETRRNNATRQSTEKRERIGGVVSGIKEIYARLREKREAAQNAQGGTATA